MLGWAGTFLAIAVVAGLFGFAGMGSVSSGAAQAVCLVFAVLFAVALIARLMR